MKNEATLSNQHFVNTWIDVLDEPEYESGKDSEN